MAMYADLRDNGKILKKIYGSCYNILVKILSPASYCKSTTLMNSYVSDKEFHKNILAIGAFVSFIVPPILTPIFILIILLASFCGYAQLFFAIIIFVWQSSWILAIVNLLKLKLTCRLISKNQNINFFSSVKKFRFGAKYYSSFPVLSNKSFILIR